MQLFAIEELSGRLLFKGGTSLSKIFHAINRFSETVLQWTMPRSASRASAILEAPKYQNRAASPS
jgi:predicted nucleotidyltransferase component of viral defense system